MTGALLLVLGSLGGCFGRTYASRMETHVEVLTSIAHKGVDLVAAGRLAAESLPEMTYPLERASAFAEQARAWAGDPVRLRSLAAFTELLARYRAFVDRLDQVRRLERGEAARAALSEPLAAVERAAVAVRAELRAEQAHA